MAYDARAIANEFIKRAKRDGMALTNMQLQKLPYIAHGWASVLLNERLITQPAEAWTYGPVYRDLYNALRRYGADVVQDEIHENDDNPFLPRGSVFQAHLTPVEARFLDDVWSVYRGYPAYQLSEMTHRQGTPWSTARAQGDFTPLDEDQIRNHYQTLLQERTTAT